MSCKLSIQAHIFSVVVLLISSALIVMAQNPVPFISQPLVPDAVAPSVPGVTITLTVNGTGFVPGSIVNWDGSPRTTLYVNGSRLMAFVLSSDIASPSTAWITVVNPAPGGGASNTLFLPINYPTATLSFQRTDYFVGGGPQFAATADFNRDGKLDLVFANFGSGSVSGLLGNGDGTFRSSTDYPAGDSPQVAMVGDFNQAGILDLAVSNWGPGLSIFMGRGDGTFQPGVGYPEGGGQHGIAADFNGDGKLDLAIADSGVSILLGNGDGTFSPGVEYAGGGFSTTVAAGDFNGDGKLDLAISNFWASCVSILIGNGDGTFQPPVDYDVGNSAFGLTVADLNGDGKLDIAVAVRPGVAVLLGNGDGTFRPHVDYPAAWASKVDVADFNQDGKLDLVAVTTGNTVDILLGNGDGSFQAPLSFSTGNRPWSPLVGDFNGDGHLDIATGNFDDGTVSVLLATPSSKLHDK